MTRQSAPHLRHVQELLLRIPKGKITTYREIGRALGTRGYRFVGQLLRQNPLPNRFPCYKVVRSDGTLGGYALGQPEKIRRLKADEILVKKDKIMDFETRLHRFR